jgi:hypothetical protein
MAKEILSDYVTCIAESGVKHQHSNSNSRYRNKYCSLVIFVASIIQEVENFHTSTHNIAEILLMLALSTNQSNNHACRVIDHLMKIDRTIIHLFSVSDSSVSCDIVRQYLFSHFNYNIYVSIYFRSRCIQREPPTLGKQLVTFNTCVCESNAPFFVIYKAGREPTPYW